MGLRVTDDRVIKIVEEVMIEFNKEIVDSLEKNMCKAKTVTIKENNVIYVKQKNIELSITFDRVLPCLLKGREDKIIG